MDGLRNWMSIEEKHGELSACGNQLSSRIFYRDCLPTL